ncbi:hypothetical protein EXQ27_04185 [Clostridium botulinum]|uniref:hypothetical protein n=1 Tax=Clostridium botulinum TaxID=1491 RepID=UPI001A9222C6|nr:hypothetical protein [Clostridium botulinum]MBO0537914.1 hypothetical protein [Clostridium botulinum]MBO0580376.1 hypothetical protein [Clostridium botulinum]
MKNIGKTPKQPSKEINVKLSIDTTEFENKLDRIERKLDIIKAKSDAIDFSKNLNIVKRTIDEIDINKIAEELVKALRNTINKVSM